MLENDLAICLIGIITHVLQIIPSCGASVVKDAMPVDLKVGSLMVQDSNTARQTELSLLDNLAV